jgi:AcrR family transcriptional regulator
MARPSGNADQKMLAVAIKIARTKGCTAVRIRDVVEKANVNLGMFHYHFRNRENFISIVLRQIYGEFFVELTRVANTPGDPLTQLRGAALFLGAFAKKHQVLILSLFKDLIAEDPEVLKFSCAQTIPPHAKLFRDLLGRCQEQKLLKPYPLSQTVPLFFGAITQPLIMNDVAKRLRKKLDWLDIEEAMSPEALEARIDIVLRGMGAKI